LPTLKILTYYAYFHLSRDKQNLRELWQNRQVVLSLNGVKFAISAVPGDLGFILEVFLRGAYEPIPSFIPKPGDVCMDIGANIGSCALRWRLNDRSGRIICIEPHPVTYKRLQKNIEINSFTNIESYPFAVSDLDGPMEMYTPEGSSMMVASDKLKRHKTVVKAVTIDTMVRQAGLSRIDLCKIDVEGHEIKVLNGAVNSLHLIRNLVIEYHSDSLRNEVIDKLKNGFSVIREEGSRQSGLIFAENNSAPGTIDRVQS